MLLKTKNHDFLLGISPKWNRFGFGFLITEIRCDETWQRYRGWMFQFYLGPFAFVFRERLFLKTQIR